LARYLQLTADQRLSGSAAQRLSKRQAAIAALAQARAEALGHSVA
jgi:hypothetical protein